jgi:hypothetical protein
MLKVTSAGILLNSKIILNCKNICHVLKTANDVPCIGKEVHKCNKFVVVGCDVISLFLFLLPDSMFNEKWGGSTEHCRLAHP